MTLEYWLRRVRILFLLGVFYVLYEKFHLYVWAFLFMFFFILSDISDIEQTLADLKKERESWKNILTRRKDF
jgi:hypothetical protein